MVCFYLYKFKGSLGIFATCKYRNMILNVKRDDHHAACYIARVKTSFNQQIEDISGRCLVLYYGATPTCTWISVCICFPFFQCWRWNMNNLYLCLIHFFIQQIYSFTSIRF